MSIFKTIVKLKKQLNQSLVFSSKIEANRAYNQFLKDNCITVRFNDPFSFFYQGEKHIATIGNRYAAKKVNLCYKVLGSYLEIIETGEIIKFK